MSRAKASGGFRSGAALLLATTAAVLIWTAPVEAQSGKPSAVKARGDVMRLPVGSFAPMLERVVPAVVSVLVTGATAEPVDLKPREADGRLLPPAQPRKTPFRSGGSGVIVDPAKGHIITNNHVIADAISIEISTYEGRRMPARLVGTDVATDIAVLEVAARDLPGLPIGNSDAVKVGDVVLAIGNPYGLESTATLGIVSALMRSGIGHEAFEDFMQVDAPINPGNSGGALVNVRGELIGINTAGPADPSRASGIGFVIPINMARTIKAELIAHGRMRRGSPGLVVEDLTFELMKQIGTSITRGARITGVVPGSSAAAAGVSIGGIVTAIGGKPVRTAAEFATRVSTVPAGTPLDVTIVENEKPRTYKLVAAEIRLPHAEITVPDQVGGIAGAVVSDIVLGDPQFGRIRGAKVLRVPSVSRAYAAGLAEGDVIVGLDGGSVRSTEDLVRLADRAGMQYRLRLMRGDVPGWIRVVR